MDNSPQAMREALGLDDISSAAGYLDSAVFGSLLPLLAMIFGVIELVGPRSDSPDSILHLPAGLGPNRAPPSAPTVCPAGVFTASLRVVRREVWSATRPGRRVGRSGEGVIREARSGVLCGDG